ncbi:hypothetical protein [Serratia proteamaculans]|uniref:hypothetical protein n=1 Tax=Serratia proteamaculans TaxID=28151 RepID=UPI0010201091|nr:hypothetical protein [Serratia proteamaculans]RYM55606.1 hypothetical protein BSQ96_02555 [Serratia proteamaculans]
MTKTLTTEQLQDIYEAAVREEATGNPDESGQEAFDLLCLLDATGGTGATIRKLIDMARAANREAQPVAEVLSSRSGNDTSTIDKALPAGTKVYTAPPAPAPAVLEEINPDSPIIIGILPDSDWTRREKCIAADMWNACRAAMLAQPVSQGCELPDNVREALTLALQAMEFMGDTLNNIDAVCTEDVEYVTPAFTAVRGLLEAAPEGGNG